MNYYNEIDPKAAAWLRELIRCGHLPPGDVDERTITEVKFYELENYNQCHFFAGIGGWARALRLAGWPDDKPVWTGSCPCQPFSVAGKGLGKEDPRHLWPFFHDLIAFGSPPVVFGEQVASAAGREWLAGVRSDLEGVGYAVGAADLCAAGVGAPHIRQRLYWVAHAIGGRLQKRDAGKRGPWLSSASLANGGLENASGIGWRGRSHGNSQGRGGALQVARPGGSCGLGDSVRERRAGQSQPVMGGNQDHWSGYDLIPCADGKTRRVKSGVQCLADGIPARVLRLRGYGNAIVPPLAAEFISAAIETGEIK